MTEPFYNTAEWAPANNCSSARNIQQTGSWGKPYQNAGVLPWGTIFETDEPAVTKLLDMLDKTSPIVTSQSGQYAIYNDELFSMADMHVRNIFKCAESFGITIQEIRRHDEDDIRIYYVVVECESIEVEWYKTFGKIELEIYDKSGVDEIDFRYIPSAVVGAGGIIPKSAISL